MINSPSGKSLAEGKGLLRRTGTRAAAAVAAGTLVLAGGGVAWADDVYNTLDTTIDSVAEVLPLNVGGANGSTTLAVDPQKEDGKNGCNLTGQTTLTLQLTSSDPSVATVSPSIVVFSACGDAKQLTVSPVGSGSATITATQTSNTTDGTFNLAPAAFRVDVAAPAPSNTAPVLTISGVAAGGSYTKGLVPAAVCTVTDKEDGITSFAATLGDVAGPDAAYGIGTREASCSHTDKGGLTAASSVTYGITDGTAPKVSYTLSPATPDGLSDWYKSAVALDWTVTEGDSPSTLGLIGCEDQSITADQMAEDYSCTAKSSGGTTQAVTVNLKKDGTAPTVGYTDATGTEGTNGWYTSDVEATFTGTDPISGLLAATQKMTTSGEGSTVQVASPAFTDVAGNTTAAGAATQTFKIDKTAPDVEYVDANGTTGRSGWYTSDVQANFTATDLTSGPLIATQAVASSGEGEAVKVQSPEFTDNAGNTTPAGAASQSFMIDKTAPTVSYVSTSPAANDDDWHNTDVEVTFEVGDATSGVEVPTRKVVSEGEGSSVKVASPAVEDRAGNVTAAGAAWKTLQIDKTAPTVSFTSVLGDNYFGSTPPEPGCTADDSLSQLAGSCKVEGYGTAVGTHTLRATATDKAGNSTTVTQTYTVKAWTLKGFYQPIDMGGVLNTVKGGSTVPAKFEVFAGDTEITDPNLMKFTMGTIVCAPNAFTDAIETTAAAGSTVVRYDAIAGQFVYNWKTPTVAGSCYKLTMTAKDGSSISANFKLK